MALRKHMFMYILDVYVHDNLTAFAFAELIDNALSATHSNKGRRQIEVRLVGTSLLLEN